MNYAMLLARTRQRIVPPTLVPIITITQQPQNATAVAGGATFSVSAESSDGSSLSYQWQSSVDGVQFTNIAGATSPTLNLAGLTTADNGNRYRVAIDSDTVESKTSDSAELTVPALSVSFSNQPQDISVELGQSGTFSATALASIGGVAYQWQSRGANVETWTDRGRLSTQSTGTIQSNSDNVYRVSATAFGGLWSFDAPFSSPLLISTTYGDWISDAFWGNLYRVDGVDARDAGTSLGVSVGDNKTGDHWSFVVNKSGNYRISVTGRVRFDRYDEYGYEVYQYSTARATVNGTQVAYDVPANGTDNLTPDVADIALQSGDRVVFSVPFLEEQQAGTALFPNAAGSISGGFSITLLDEGPEYIATVISNEATVFVFAT